MRLDSPFVRLPIRVDAAVLDAEIAALGSDAWRAHPEGAPGNTAVPLVAHRGDPGDDRAKGVMAPTPHLDRLPYVRRVLGALDSVIGRTRLMRIEEEGELTSHIDTNYYWRDHLRVHVPVVTTPDVRFECDDEQVHMGAGEVWVFDTWRPHRVVNPSGTPRIHLVVDTVGGPNLWRRIDQPDGVPDEVGVNGAEPPLVTERVNQPLVMTPWELEHALDLLLGELDASDPSAAAALDAPVLELERAWREAWARFGDDPDGWDHFTALRVAADAALASAAGDVRLPNGVLAIEAIRQHALRAAVDPDRGAPEAVPPPTLRPTLARAASPAPAVTGVDFDRPVFVVSSPRSGSTLLFETLARAPDLFTIGGESHRVIESIPGLHPRAHDWDSNRLVADDATSVTVEHLRRAFAAQLRDRDGRAPTDGAVRLLEKTPKNSLRVPFLAAAFPDALFVYLYRDPRETVSSMLDAWRSGRFVTYADLPGWGQPPWSLLLVPGWRDVVGASPAEIVTTQWATATDLLLDDLEQLDPDRWCVTSYDAIVRDAQAEMERLAAFCGIGWDVELEAELPLSRHTLDSPDPDKWRRNADELEPHWDRVREVAVRAHGVFASPPRIKPVPRSARPRPAPAPPTPAPPASAEPAAGDADRFDSVHTASFPDVLSATGASLLVSTYQSGRVIVVRTDGRGLNTHFRFFQVPMGMAARPGELVIGAKTQVQRFQNQPALSARLDPPGLHDACFVPRSIHHTGDIRIHDMAFAGDELWAVNTRFSCLSTFADDYSFVPQWRPPFVTALAAEDRCHLNGMAVVDGAPRYVTALGTTDTESGWREHKSTGGVVLDVPSGEVVVGGLCMPHSPRWHDDRLWLLESGKGAIGYVDLARGRYEEVARVPGFTRGLAFVGPFAFVGLSQVRETLFEGIPLKADGVERSCGVWVIDVRNGSTAAFLRFEGVVQELFEVLALPGIRYPEIVEPDDEVLDTSFVLPDAALADLPPASG
jgi:uncharacterized protein (TIGR03032 family)